MVYFPTAEQGLSHKLAGRWDGPYHILNKTNAVTYRVKLVDKSRIKIMLVHVQRMKKYTPWSGATR